MPIMRLGPTLKLLVLVGIASPSVARAAQPPEVDLTFPGDRFEPPEAAVPADTKFILRIQNKSTVAALSREKVVPAVATAKVILGPLKAGSHEFFDDFHRAIHGRVVAR